MRTGQHPDAQLSVSIGILQPFEAVEEAVRMGGYKKRREKTRKGMEL
jgi:hypothetical protein